MYTMCQRLYTFGLEVKFTRVGDFTWRVSDCEELSGGLLTGDDVNELVYVVIFSCSQYHR